jgi:hypothetical protein
MLLSDSESALMKQDQNALAPLMVAPVPEVLEAGGHDQGCQECMERLDIRMN